MLRRQIRPQVEHWVGLATSDGRWCKIGPENGRPLHLLNATQTGVIPDPIQLQYIVLKNCTIIITILLPESAF